MYSALIHIVGISAFKNAVLLLLYYFNYEIDIYLFILCLRSIAGQHTNLHKRSHFDDVQQKWGLVIFHGDE